MRGPQAVPFDAANCLEVGLELVAGVLSVSSDFLALTSVVLLLLHSQVFLTTLLLTILYGTLCKRHSCKLMDGAAWLAAKLIQAGKNGELPLS